MDEAGKTWIKFRLAGGVMINLFTIKGIKLKHPPDFSDDDGNDFIARLKAGQSYLLGNLYDRHGPSFLSWASKRFNANQVDIEDAWQEAVAVFYERAVSGKLSDLKCSVKTYLFAVGYRRLLKYFRKRRRFIWNLDEVDKAIMSNQLAGEVAYEDIWEDERIILREAMNDLTPRCRKILARRHFDERTIDELMKEFNYSSKNGVSVVLHECLKSLIKIIAEKTKK